MHSDHGPLLTAFLKSSCFLSPIENVYTAFNIVIFRKRMINY